ncbi:ATP-binding protein [Pseudolysobacter antarcticus]|uniref:ATP-binding protein n=2 Tax=Pseudolysobacter antarcticus TaxID=2511995 RepID=A0A411HQ93_9GAMM|nr:ATP-binding protein [Pseudolysobacter antarcticus]
MITRDITLEDCILDLIDNSVDGAWQLLGGAPMSLDDNSDLSNYCIRISLSEDQFEIRDNCGGITLDEASEYAFTFGRKDEVGEEDYSIGVYGIGMKRAIFKMGSEIQITSTYKDNGKKSFKVPIDVNNWLAKEDRNWDFDLESADNLTEPGVRIVVNKLNEDTSSSFSSPAFIQNLRRTISRDYALHLARGLVVSINNEPVVGWQIRMLLGDAFAPMRQDYVEIVDGGSVRVEMLAGMAAAPPESSEPDVDDRREDRNGWYVVCNGRIVVAADKTSITGWGTDGWPQWHPQYSGFIGLVMFTAQAAKLLPLTTTKRSVDSSSGVYRKAKPAMREASKAWIAYTNERKQALPEARRLEAHTQPISIREVTRRESVSLPSLIARPVIPMANISYTVSRDRVRLLAQAYGNINFSYKDVGVRSFEDAYSELVGDE